ncbi:MAG: hypothetical protein Q9193_004421 [Seirophora villosa]
MASHGAQLPVEKLVDSENSPPHSDSDNAKASHKTDDYSVPYSVFSQSTRRWTVLLVALAGFFSPLSANIYFPALNYLAHDLNVSLKLINLTITAYLIFQGIVPFIVGDAADKMGRRPVYIVAFVVYLGANIGLALQNSYPALLVLRVLQSSGSSETIALAISVVADLAPPHERGKYMGAALCGPNTAPSLVFEKDTALVLVLNAIFYVNYTCLQASLSPLMMDLYRLNALQAGLTYLPYGIACGVTSILVGKLSQCYRTIRLVIDPDRNSGRVMDRDYRMTAAAVGFTIDKTNGDDLTSFPIEKARLRSIWYYVSVSTICTVGYGWTLETRTVCNTLVVDLHPDRPATASAAVSITRCSAAAVGVSILQFMLDGLGPGWTFTLFGALGASTLPMLWFEYQWGMKWRTERLGKRTERTKEEKEKKASPG